ncbi:hypothetical protein BDN72DRAFT_902160 [Pluteus cervinus]|uniref:Uncharacterized protein n=1 Tax=Pluteus cervinus TaxID=181527 RepID=A0ACD3AE88_9AGAR|nr:hypothetical protein BDN72DRAFT_902160 [Pluteus cervinus]
MATNSSDTETDSQDPKPLPPCLSLLRLPKPTTPVPSPGTPIQGISYVPETPPSENNRYPSASPGPNLQTPFVSSSAGSKRRRVDYPTRELNVNTVVNLANHEVLMQAENPYYMKSVEEVEYLRDRVQELEVENRTLRYAFEHLSDKHHLFGLLLNYYYQHNSLLPSNHNQATLNKHCFPLNHHHQRVRKPLFFLDHYQATPTSASSSSITIIKAPNSFLPSQRSSWFLIRYRVQPSSLLRSTFPMKASFILFALLLVVVLWVKHSMRNIKERFWGCIVDFLWAWFGQHSMGDVVHRLWHCLADIIWTFAIGFLSLTAFIYQLTVDLERLGMLLNE